MSSLLSFVLLLVLQNVPPDMVQIPAGEYWMGRTHMWLLDELSMNLTPRLDDQPVHRINVDAFLMDKYEVSNENYAKFTAATAWVSLSVREGERMWVWEATLDGKHWPNLIRKGVRTLLASSQKKGS